MSVRNYIDTFMARQGKLLDAAKRPQEATNDRRFDRQRAWLRDG